MQEGSRKGLGRVQEGGLLCRKGGGFLCRKGVPGGFLGQFLSREGGGSSVTCTCHSPHTVPN